MEKHWVGQDQFDKHHDKYGSFIIMDGEKWYIGAPEEMIEGEEYPDWVDSLLLLLSVAVIAAAVVVYIWG